MSNSKLELKVGVFVLACLAVLGVLLIQFSKGTSLFRPTYTILLKAGNVGGLKPNAGVLMSGVNVGNVKQIKLTPEGTNVVITLKIYREYVIHESARFSIEQSGFLGDQYVAIYPQGNEGAKLGEPGHLEANVEEPFNMQEVARNAAGFILRIDETARRLNDTISDVRRLVLNEKTLTNLAYSVSQLRQFSDDAETAAQNLNGLVVSNRALLGQSVTNLVVFTDHLDALGGQMQEVVRTNSPQISLAISNVQMSTEELRDLLHEVQMGRGLAGSLMANEPLANNFSLLASNLAVTSSNLNRFGLWRIIRGVKPAKPADPPKEPKLPGRDPFTE